MDWAGDIKGAATYSSAGVDLLFTKAMEKWPRNEVDNALGAGKEGGLQHFPTCCRVCFRDSTTIHCWYPALTV